MYEDATEKKKKESSILEDDEDSYKDEELLGIENTLAESERNEQMLNLVTQNQNFRRYLFSPFYWCQK